MLPDILNYIPDPKNGRPIADGQVFFFKGGYLPPTNIADVNPSFIAEVTANGNPVPQPIYTSKGGTLIIGSQTNQPQLNVDPLVKRVAVYDKCGRLVYSTAYNGVGAFVDADALAAPDSTVLVGGVAAGRIAKRLNYKTFAELGGIADGLTDNRAAWIAAIAAAAGNFTIKITRGIYGFNDWIPLASNLNVDFEDGAEFKLLAGTGPIGGFVVGGVDLAFSPIPFSNTTIRNMVVDCNDLIGENAINALNADNINIHSPTVKNCKRTDLNLGGRAFQFEGGIARRINVYNPQIINCSIGINSQAAPLGTYVAADINYHDVVMRNVDVPFNVDCGFANPETNTESTMSTTVNGATLYNCGRLTYPGVTDPVGGGIICGDRGYGLTVNDLRVVNDPSYGGIGALVRGTMYNVSINNAQVTGGMTALFDHNPVGFGTPSSASHASFINVNGVHHTGNLDFIIMTKSGGGALGASSMRDISIDGAVSTLAGVCDANAGTYNDAVLEIIDRNNPSVGKHVGSGVRTLKEFFDSGNVLNERVMGRQKIVQRSGLWTPLISSTGGNAATMVMSASNAEWTLDGDYITVTAYISTSNVDTTGLSGALTISGLPFASGSYSASGLSFSSGWTNAPSSAAVAPSEQFVRLYKRIASGDVAMTPNDLLAGVNASANACILSISYRVRI